jgi:hypothetical protein
MAKNEKITLLQDDDLTGVAGGASGKDVMQESAKADGRLFLVPSQHVREFCNCSGVYGSDCVWAASYKTEGRETIYYDVKCYNCGHQKKEFKSSLVAARYQALVIEEESCL